MKIVFFSDTHTAHYTVTLPKADIHVFTGDLTARGSSMDVEKFLKWYSKQDSKHKVMIAGNHDFFFDPGWKEGSYLEEHQTKVKDMLDQFPNITYLEDSGATIEGIKFWGSPITPWFHDWAFNRTRCNGQDGVANGIKQHWDKIPNDTEILLVHGPAYGILDLIVPKFRRGGEDPHVGCKDLLDALDRVQPYVMAFGHIHEGYGKEFDKNGTLHINSSINNENYEPINEPIELLWDQFIRNRKHVRN